jgi:hypothetical protein
MLTEVLMKKVKSGDDKYVAKDEKYDKKMKKKAVKGMKTAGIATELKESQREMGYSKMPKVKPQRKV